ncbi:protein Smaug homolog 2 isoform X2 [Coccinella septempunctata]|nr:protein Smaug homolog 2 isoform X2 [Coccinella septempunctata]
MESNQMRDFSEFCEQLHDMRLKFHRWDSCERTIALYYLMAGLPFANARFLQHAIEGCIAAVKTPEAQILEKNANDVNYITNMLAEHPQNSLSLLLTHLPLLRPGNKETAHCYLNAIKKVLSGSITPPYKIHNECVELMSYVFVHPAFDKNDKKNFKHLLKQVLNKVSPETFVPSQSNGNNDEAINTNPEPTQNEMRQNRRSNSLTPAQTKSFDNFQQSQVWTSQENLTQPSPKQRSYSLSNDKPLVISVPPIQVSSSETRLQDIEALKNYPVMKSIVSWLKSLRLHKYSWIFTNLSYHQMLNLDEATLEGIGITKGARHKLLLNLGKLKERSMLMCELETEVMNGGDLNNALKKLKNLLQTPLQVSIGEDLPSKFVRVMGKVFSQLLMLRKPTDETLSLFSTICERADLSDAFTEDQKHRLAMWQNQLTKGPCQIPFSMQYGGLSQKPVHYQNFNNSSVPKSSHHHQAAYAKKSSSFPNVQVPPMHTGHRHSIGSVTLQNQLTNFPVTQPWLHERHVMTVPYEKSVNYKETGQQHQVRFQNVEEHEVRRKQQILKNLDIESSLESLCLQMMEHALGP